MESLEFEFETIKLATDNFSEANKLGQGGFGAVYKGNLADGQKIAVKRLDKASEQGEAEFRNEILLLAKLQHRNLVRLLGFCLQGSERVLVYQFVPNASLDQFIFDPTKRTLLDWERRHKIIRGIARGVLYLHEDSRLRVIHRDLKPGNILLGIDMNPEIADFGMARLFNLDDSQAVTYRIAGTPGYMAPEYLFKGQISVKSDVFSYGVLVLEIVSGKRNNSFPNGEDADDIIGYAWKKWKNGTTINMVDPLLTSGSSEEMMRCIHIGLLCCEYNKADRPTMSEVMLMLDGSSYTLKAPTQPGFFMDSTNIDYNSKTTSYDKFKFLNKIGLGFFLKKQKRPKEITKMGESSNADGISDTNGVSHEDEIISSKYLEFDFHTIKVATNKFSAANIFGKGSHHTQYKGILKDGQEIFIKRLEKYPGQGEQEFDNEVVLVAKLQHPNIVRHLGFCIQGSEKLLVYEFVPNASLDQFIFHPTRRTLLNWETRKKIIRGVARGVLYLHEDSRLPIIHLDLKPSNILLDKDMIPKIANFGTAKLFKLDQTQGETRGIVGICGYIAPEYAFFGQFSVKTDVFSFGVLVLEIVSGQKNNCFRNGESVERLIQYTRKCWEDGTILNIVDRSLASESSSEMMRCIHIGLLCVQENVVHRPTMANVVLMLNSNSIILSSPIGPSSLMHSNIGSDLSSSTDYNSENNLELI